MAWSLERVGNPSLLVVHVTAELTTRTIESFPPGAPPAPLDAILGVSGVVRLDIHRYRARITVSPRWERDAIGDQVAPQLGAVWGPGSPTPKEALPRAFEVGYDGPRLVAESLEMAAGQTLLSAAFGVPGVAEAILAPGLALVRLGRLFSWEAVEAPLVEALARA